MKQKFADLPTWTFEVDQMHEEIFYVIAKDKTGHQVCAEGLNRNQIIEQCRQYASYIDRSQHS